MRRVRRHARRTEGEEKKTESEGRRLVEERVEHERILSSDEQDEVDEEESEE